MKLLLFQASDSLFKGLNGDVGSDSLHRIREHRKSQCCPACLADREPESTGTLYQSLNWPVESNWDIWGNRNLSRTSFLGDRMKFLHFILCYLCRARVSKETGIANISCFGNTQMQIQPMSLPKCKPDTTSLDHAQCKPGFHAFSENEGKL